MVSPQVLAIAAGVAIAYYAGLGIVHGVKKVRHAIGVKKVRHAIAHVFHPTQLPLRTNTELTDHEKQIGCFKSYEDADFFQINCPDGIDGLFIYKQYRRK